LINLITERPAFRRKIEGGALSFLHPMNEDSIQSFREKLNQYYAWPALYTFKFILPANKESEVIALFPLHHAAAKASKTGKYASVTFQMMMPSADAVIEIYQKAATVEGLIAL
jgi:hypothetical protein